MNELVRESLVGLSVNTAEAPERVAKVLVGPEDLLELKLTSR